MGRIPFFTCAEQVFWRSSNRYCTNVGFWLMTTLQDQDVLFYIVKLDEIHSPIFWLFCFFTSHCFVTSTYKDTHTCRVCQGRQWTHSGQGELNKEINRLAWLSCSLYAACLTHLAQISNVRMSCKCRSCFESPKLACFLSHKLHHRVQKHLMTIT